MKNSRVCVDASVVLKLVLREVDSDKANALWSTWIEEDVEIVAPYHLAFEVTSVIRNRVYRNEITIDAGRQAYAAIQQQPILLLHPDLLSDQAWTLAERFNRPTAYDAFYLALGEIVGCNVWTADTRLFNSVRTSLPWVKLLRDFPIPGQ